MFLREKQIFTLCAKVLRAGPFLLDFIQVMCYKKIQRSRGAAVDTTAPGGPRYRGGFYNMKAYFSRRDFLKVSGVAAAAAALAGCGGSGSTAGAAASGNTV